MRNVEKLKTQPSTTKLQPLHPKKIVATIETRNFATIATKNKFCNYCDQKKIVTIAKKVSTVATNFFVAGNFIAIFFLQFKFFLQFPLQPIFFQSLQATKQVHVIFQFELKWSHEMVKRSCAGKKEPVFVYGISKRGSSNCNRPSSSTACTSRRPQCRRQSRHLQLLPTQSGCTSIKLSEKENCAPWKW